MTTTFLGIAQTSAPASSLLQQAYTSLNDRNYEEAVAGFRQAIRLAPERAAIHIDLAYTLLKIGENEAARDEFAEAMRLEPADDHVALEYAFLCYETKQPMLARRVFDRIRKNGNAIAEEAFQNIDRPLADGIARWSRVVEISPDNFSAHQELATLAEQRDNLDLAAEHYEKAWRIKPSERLLLLDLGRVWQAMGHKEEAYSALFAASRGTQPRVVEKARELLPSRYPYVYEFERALDLDSGNTDLRRELAYLLLEMGKSDEAEAQFLLVRQAAPDDLLTAAQLGFLRLQHNDVAGAQPLFDQVLKGGNKELADRVRRALQLPQTLKSRPEDPAGQKLAEAKDLAEKSLKAGYLKDAVKYLTIAHEFDPMDASLTLKLGWVYNTLHDDGEAIQWFNLARKSPDAAIASEANQAYTNLRPVFAPVRTTLWVFPFFSTRWHDVFGYGQIKTEFRLGKLPFRPYLSLRFIGDTRETTNVAPGVPEYLSETSFILGAGVATLPWHGLNGWFEVGEAIKYLPDRTDTPPAMVDYRGGLSYARGFGHLLNGSHGLFFETNEDAVFVSRFQDDMILYSQNRSGYTFPVSEYLGLQTQLYWNVNGTADRLHQYWANFIETGPGLKFRFQGLPKSLIFSANFLRGVYTVNQGNPRRPNFFDLRVGIWYAFTH